MATLNKSEICKKCIALLKQPLAGYGELFRLAFFVGSKRFRHHKRITSQIKPLWAEL